MSNKINNQITAKTVFVVDDAGEKLGVMPTTEALEKARSEDKDLVEIVPNAVPPVCKITSFSKLQYQLKKAHKQQRSPSQKTFKFNINIDPHDLGIKAKQMGELLAKGHPIQVLVLFHGREVSKKDQGFKLIETLKTLLPTSKFDNTKAEEKQLIVNIRK